MISLSCYNNRMYNTITIPASDNVDFFMLPESEAWSFYQFFTNTVWPSEAAHAPTFAIVRAIRRDTVLMDLKRDYATLFNGQRGNPAKREEIKDRWASRIQTLIALFDGNVSEDTKAIAGECFPIDEAHIVSLPRGTRFKFQEYEDSGIHYIITEQDLDQVA